MANSEYRRQQQLARKRKQRKEKKKRQASASASEPIIMPPSLAAKAPIHECLMPPSLFEVGIGNLVFSRALEGGLVAISAFLVDIYCLGVKNALYAVRDRAEYTFVLNKMDEGGGFKSVEPACLRKLVEGAVAYADDLGFKPHSDYAKASQIFGAVDVAACPESFTYGDRGKPHYMSGPSENAARRRSIVEQLARRVGEGNYDVTMMGEGLF